MADPFTQHEQPVAAIVQRSASGRRLALSVLGLCAVLLVLGLLAGWPLLVRTLDSYLRRQKCAEQMHKIAVGLQNYCDEYGAYPPAIVHDARGQPAHSWRVLILPYLGQNEEQLYKRYRLDEPWDGPNNRPLADEMPRVYACPLDPGAVESNTSYLALVNAANGRFAAQPPAPTAATPKPTAPVDKLVVEVAESGILWTEPKDLMLGPTTGPSPPVKLAHRFSYHVDGSHMVDTDGQATLLSDQKLRAVLEAADKAIVKANGASTTP